MGFISDFKTFIMKGNIIDLAVAVIIGAAFGKIVTSLVDDIIMPVVGLLMGGIDFSRQFFALDGESLSFLRLTREPKERRKKLRPHLQDLLRSSY